MATITVPAQADKLVGKAIRRREDPRLLTGTATYVDDIRMPGMHHACIVRSPHAAAQYSQASTRSRARHARRCRRLYRSRCQGCRPSAVRRFPARPARARTIAFLRRIACITSATPSRSSSRPTSTSRAMPPMLIDVDYDPIPGVGDPELAMKEGAPLVHPEYGDNVAFRYHQEGGDIVKAFAEADVVVKQRIVSQRLIPTSMETRGVVAELEYRREVSDACYTSTQIPHLAAHADCRDAGHSGKLSSRRSLRKLAADSAAS